MYQRTQHQGYKGSHNPFIDRGANPVQTTTDTVQEAIVIDRVVNDKHSQYDSVDGYNVGCVQFRLIKSNQYRDQASLNWAWPLDSNISEYPLENEIVHIISSLNRFYYTRKINAAIRVTSQPLFGLEQELSPIEGSAEKVATFQKSVANPSRPGPQAGAGGAQDGVLGKIFKEPTPRVYRLRHDEGDVVYEGRSGHSIRFGAAWLPAKKTQFIAKTKNQSPNLMIRVGQDPEAVPNVDTDWGLVTEDINKDLSSVYMVTDQLVELKYSTLDKPWHTKSVDDFPAKLEGNQIVINTDRFVVNTKTNKIMGHSHLGVHWTTNRDYTTDIGRDKRNWVNRDEFSDVQRDLFTFVGRNHRQRVFNNSTVNIGNVYELSAVTRISLAAPQVFLGMQSDRSQPVPLGQLLAAFLTRFIDAHLVNAANHVTTVMGPGALTPPVVQALSQLKQDVLRGAGASFNSRYVYAGQNAPSGLQPPPKVSA